MIILQRYKSVVFWLIFVSLWIIGCWPCCNDGKKDGTTGDVNKGKNNVLINNNNSKIDYNNSSNNMNEVFEEKEGEEEEEGEDKLGKDGNNSNYINNDINNINNNLNNANNNINNFNNDFNNSNPTIFNEEIGFIAANINEEPMIGLGNIGATCYMNATLQCLSHTIKLSNYFLNEKYEKFIKSKKLSKGFLEVIKKLWIKSYNGNKSYYEPYNFKKLISDMNPLFKGIQANDSKDLINFILQELHNELNKAKPNQIINLLNIDQTNENQMFINFLKEFKNNQKSIISDIFYFIVETKTECLNCKQKYQMMGFNNPIYLYNF